jgi:hypothetical protein
MVTDVISHRESIGRFCPRARTVKKKRRLSALFDFVCFPSFFKHGILAFRIAIVTSYLSPVLALIALQTMNLDPDMVDLLLLIMPALSLFYYLFCAYCYIYPA